MCSRYEEAAAAGLALRMRTEQSVDGSRGSVSRPCYLADRPDSQIAEDPEARRTQSG
jgi:hypothetical protein